MFPRFQNASTRTSRPSAAPSGSNGTATADVTEAVLAFGGMAATPKRAAGAEAALIGKPFDATAADAAASALASDFAPLDDWRASARYRITVAANLIRRFQIETAAGRSKGCGQPE